MNTRRKKIRKDRLAILLVLCAVVITTIGFGIWKISGMLFHDPYETYKAYETKGKDYGDIQQVSKEYENEAFVSFTYPAYEEKEPFLGPEDHTRVNHIDVVSVFTSLTAVSRC